MPPLRSSTLFKLSRRLATHPFRHLFPCVIALVAALSGIPSAHGQTLNPFTGYTVPLNATVVSENPPALRLDWNFTSSLAVERRIYRREKTDMADMDPNKWNGTEWGTPIATLTNAANTLSYTDTTLLPGKAYEYKLDSVVSDQTATESRGFVSGGINVPMPESRGKLLLLVDSSQISALAPELAQLEQDLAGDGWTVLRNNLPRSVVEPATAFTPEVGAARFAEVNGVKSVIQTAYNADPANVKAVYIVGHLAVPYWWDAASPDGHYDHMGSQPADYYYALLGRNLTDTGTDHAYPVDAPTPRR